MPFVTKEPVRTNRDGASFHAYKISMAAALSPFLSFIAVIIRDAG